MVTLEKNCGSFRSLWLWRLIAIMKRCAKTCTLQLYSTSLIYVHSKSKVTENICNLLEWLQNMRNCKSLFKQTFISFKTFTAEKILKPTKNDQIWFVVAWSRFFIRWPHFQDGHFWVVPKVVVLYRFDCT